MTRFEREAYDAQLDTAVVAGEPCPWCGDATTAGSGPCSEACETALADESGRLSCVEEDPAYYRDCLSLATKGRFSTRERGE